MATKFPFTAARIEAIEPPDPKADGKTSRAWFYDERCPGLALLATSTGTRTFYLARRIHGRPMRLRLGAFPSMSVAQARAEAARMAGEMLAGKDPREAARKARRAAAGVPTFQAVWEHYRENHLKVYCSPKTAQGDVYFFDCVPWKRQKLDTVGVDEIRSLHQRVTKQRGATMANRVIQLLRRLFNYAIDELGYEKPNPVRAKYGRRSQRAAGTGTRVIGLNREKSRDRYLMPDELPRFFQALRDHEDEGFRHLVLLLLFTGVRRGNVQAMRWREVDLERGVWRIPNTKSGDEVTIPLSPWALEVLAARAERWAAEAEEEAKDAEWVFPAASASGHVEEPKRQWWNLIERAGIEDLRMHDLRRTMATYQRTTGATLEIISATLGHRSRAATEIYARTDLQPVRDSVATATAAILKAAGVQKALPML